ncbi:(4Fe-4S)-binding protein [Polymorphospora lycopeni]|uniref:Ferredoxin n=1 Tax=Polymorphospora lycopeni TaxID=3140240 RepID=A0ABV5CQU7_9ACTN
MSGLVVDPDRCVGAGHCARLMPQVFDQEPETGVVVWLGGQVSGASDDVVREVVALCPSGALRRPPAS